MSADSAREAAVALGDEVRSIYLAFGREEDLDWTYQDVVDRVDYTWDVLNGISDYVYMRITFFIIFSLFLAGCYVLRNPISKLIYRLLYGFEVDGEHGEYMGRSRQGAEFFVTESHLGQEDAIDRLREGELMKLLMSKDVKVAFKFQNKNGQSKAVPATLDSAVTEPENRIVTEKATYCCCMVKEVQVGKGPDPNAKSSLTRTLKATHPSKGAPYAVVWKAKV